MLHQLIAEECPGDFKAEKLAAALSNFWSKPKANISQVRVSYPRGPYRFRDLSKAVSANGNGDGSSRDGTPAEPAQDDRVSPAAAYSKLEAGRRDVRTMSLERQKELIACFQRVIKMMKSAFSTAVDFRVNEDGMPVAFLPDSSKTLELFELAQATWTRAQDECDAFQQEQLEFLPWKRGDWWRIIVMWLLHWARFRNFCPFTGLPIDLTGRAHHSMRATLCVHKDHRRRFLEDALDMKLERLSRRDLGVIDASNAFVQSWFINRQIRSDHTSKITLTFQHSRPAWRSTAAERPLTIGPELFTGAMKPLVAFSYRWIGTSTKRLCSQQ